MEETLILRRRLSEGIEAEIEALRELSAVKRLAGLGFFCILWGIGLLLSLGIGTFWWAGVICSVLALNAFVLFLHEGMHYTLFSRRWLNDIVSVLLGSTVCISYTAYRVMHLRHHDFLGDEKDPDDYHNYTDSRVVVWLLHGMRVCVGSLAYLFLVPLYALKFGTRVEQSKILAEYAFIISLYTAIFSSCSGETFFRVHGLPLLVVGLLVNLRGFTQHSLAVAEDPLLASRSVHAHPVVAFFLLNENYHLEHHLFPEVPSYNLGRLHGLLWPRLPRATRNDSYSQFLWTSLKQARTLDESPIGVEFRGKG